jgi:beta-1,4-mannosyl-glycoprotein beta-1,4-N-acetylglucosaminyltransferase
MIPNGGWHFSFFGGEKAIQHKVREGSDTWLNTPVVDNSQWVEECLAEAKDIWNRNQTMGFVEEFNQLPKYVQQNAEHYWKLGWFRHKPPGVNGA